MVKKDEGTYTLDQLLLRRAELGRMLHNRQALHAQANLFKEHIQRVPVRHENVRMDQVSGIIPRLSKEQVEEEVNFFSMKLREVDSLIQRQNHLVEIVAESSIFVDFSSDPEKLAQKSSGKVTKSLADFLTRRKQLNTICRSNLAPETDDLVHEVNTRLDVAEGVDELRKKVEPLTATEALAKSDYYYRQLQLVDVAIHGANNGTKVTAPTSLFQDFE